MEKLTGSYVTFKELVYALPQQTRPADVSDYGYTGKRHTSQLFTQALKCDGQTEGQSLTDRWNRHMEQTDDRK